MLVIGFIHESAHGLTCKHYGGEVHSMGFMLLYLMPAFFCDITEAWVTADQGSGWPPSLPASGSRWWSAAWA